ncbi:hypothetical protein [Caulobacter rhizosphaerae]|uniref:hypothetical protein n=1 Tax=Caulobacter rhizosphaerae TaxID=2010972 RepID=UPI0019BFF2FA|nr:hypothetical protein [Caulobacter rhizosphaerae]GGL36114.1 hypothetical protein GCM10010983_36540 [Caulobacter rhizosphaerae]
MTIPRAALAAASSAALLLSLSACGQKTPAGPPPSPVKTAGATPLRCPDPDIRDTKDPCSVAYIQRKPGRFTQRDPLR